MGAFDPPSRDELVRAGVKSGIIQPKPRPVPYPRPAGLPPLGQPIVPEPEPTRPLPLAPGAPAFASTRPVADELPPAVATDPLDPTVQPAEPTPVTPAKPASETTTSSVVQTPDLKKARSDIEAAEAAQTAADAKEKEAVTKENEARAAGAEVERLQMEAEAAEAEQRRQAAERDRQEGERRFNDVRAKADADAKVYADASRDQKTFFSDQNTWQKLAWGLSVMFGSQTGGENPGLAMLNRSMDAWERAKTDKLDRLERAADKSGGLLTRFWQDYGAEAKAKTDLQIAGGYEGQAERMQTLLDKRRGALDAKTQADAERAIADFQRKAADRKESAAKLRFDVAAKLAPQQSTTVERPATGGAGAGAFEGDARLVRDPFTGEPIGLTSGKPETSPEGAKIREQLSNAKPLVDEIDKVRGLVRETGAWDRLNPKSKRRLKIEGKMNMLVNPLTQILGGGSAQNDEAKRQIQMASVGLWSGSDVAEANLSGLEDFIRQQASNRARTAVLTPVPGAGVAPRGTPASDRAPPGEPQLGQTGTSNSGRPMKWNGRAWEYTD